MQRWPENPFATFLEDAEAEFHRIQPEPDVHNDAGLIGKFVQLQEDRHFVFDIVDRVRALAAAFDRLHDLSNIYSGLQTRPDELINEQRPYAPGSVLLNLPDEIRQHEELCRAEAQALVAFTYYELSTLVSLLRKLFSPTRNSDLEYLVGVRNKLLAHPRKDGRTKNSNSALSWGRILHAHLVGGESWIPLVRNHYLAKLGTCDTEAENHAGEVANMKLLRGTKIVERFTATEVLMLKAHVIREPNLLGSAGEMAALLHTHFLPETKRVCAATTDRIP